MNFFAFAMIPCFRLFARWEGDGFKKMNRVVKICMELYDFGKRGDEGRPDETARKQGQLVDPWKLRGRVERWQ